MSFVSMHDYALEVRREARWDVATTIATDQANVDLATQLGLPSEAGAKAVENLRASTIIEWTLDEGPEGEGLEGCSCGCGCG